MTTNTNKNHCQWLLGARHVFVVKYLQKVSISGLLVWDFSTLLPTTYWYWRTNIQNHSLSSVSQKFKVRIFFWQREQHSLVFLKCRSWIKVTSHILFFCYLQRERRGGFRMEINCSNHPKLFLSCCFPRTRQTSCSGLQTRGKGRR